MTRITLPATLELENIKTTLAAIKEANNTDLNKTIVLQGQPDIFCLGMSFEYLTSHTQQQTHHAIDLFAELIYAINSAKKPTIALVQGKALAGGAGLAAACDFVITGPKALFGFSEALFGLLPGIILPFLLQRMSPHKAKQLILSANTINAEQALNYGLADEIVNVELLESHLQRTIKNLSRIESNMVIKVKGLITESLHLPLDHALQQGRALLKEALADSQVTNNIHRYAEYGIVPWEGSTYDFK